MPSITTIRSECDMFHLILWLSTMKTLLIIAMVIHHHHVHQSHITTLIIMVLSSIMRFINYIHPTASKIFINHCYVINYYCGYYPAHDHKQQLGNVGHITV